MTVDVSTELTYPQRVTARLAAQLLPKTYGETTAKAATFLILKHGTEYPSAFAAEHAGEIKIGGRWIEDWVESASGRSAESADAWAEHASREIDAFFDSTSDDDVKTAFADAKPRLADIYPSLGSMLDSAVEARELIDAPPMSEATERSYESSVHEMLGMPVYAEPWDVIERVTVRLFMEWADDFVCDDSTDTLSALERLSDTRGGGYTTLLKAYVDLQYVLPEMRTWGAFSHGFREQAGCDMADVYPRDADNTDFARNSVWEFAVTPITGHAGRQRFAPMRRRVAPDLRDISSAYSRSMEDHIALRRRAIDTVIQNRHLITYG